jgi:subtilase family serine protease
MKERILLLVVGVSVSVCAAFPAEADLPDLAISCSHSPPNPDTQTIITFVAEVRNVGTFPSRPSRLMFGIVGGATLTVPSLNPGATFTVTRKRFLPVAQPYYNHVVADYDWRIRESDKNNNECWHFFHVRPVEAHK